MANTKPTEGICFFAYNNEQIDYIKLTYMAATYAKKYLKRPVCLITDAGTESWMADNFTDEQIEQTFDHVVITNDEMKKNVRVHHDNPWNEFRAQFSNSNKHKVWEYSPFDKTLLLDVDYIVKNDFLSNLFDYEGVAMFDEARSIRNEMPHAREQWLYDAGIKMWWSTVVYFDRSVLSKHFFDMWAHVADNYEYYQYLYNFPGHMFRTDYCVSIACHILNGMQDGDLINNIANTPMYYMDQKDDLVEIKNEQEWIYLANDTDKKWENILVNHKHLDVHAMNKRALLRNWDDIMESINV